MALTIERAHAARSFLPELSWTPYRADVLALATEGLVLTRPTDTLRDQYMRQGRPQLS